MTGRIMRIGLFLSCICINIAWPQKLKVQYWDPSSAFEQKVTQECSDKEFAQLVNEANSYSYRDYKRELQDEENLKKAAELYEQIINDYPEYFTVTMVQSWLFGSYVRLYVQTDDKVYREKALSTAWKAIQRINKMFSGGTESEFLEWLRNELTVRLLLLEEEIPESQVKAAKDFYLMSLSDRITTDLQSHNYGRLSEIYIEEKNIPEAMKYIHKGLSLANELGDKTKKGSFLYLATMAMAASGDKKMADEFYRQLIEVRQPSPEIKRIIDKRLSRKYGIKLSETPSAEE